MLIFGEELSTLQLLLAVLIMVFGAVLGWIVETLRRRAFLRNWDPKHITNKALVLKSMRGLLFFWIFSICFITVLMFGESPTLARAMADIVFLLIVLSVTLGISTVAGFLIGVHTSKAAAILPSTSLVIVLVRSTVVLIGMMYILNRFGITITPMLAAFGIIGLTVALGLQGMLSNFFAGLQVIASQNVKPGDFIELDNGDKGYVTDVAWNFTTLRTLKDTTIIVPNSKLANSVVENNSNPKHEMSLWIPCRVHYKSDMDRVHEVTLEVAREAQKCLDGAIRDFEPKMRYVAFRDHAIETLIILRVKEYGCQFAVRTEFMKMLKRRYREEGIVIPYPIRTLESPPGASTGPDAEMLSQALDEGRSSK